MGRVNMKSTVYYKSGIHTENIGIARKKAIQRTKELKQARVNEYYQKPTLCLSCSSILPYEKKKDKIKFCSQSCSASYNNKKRPPQTKEQRQKKSETLKAKNRGYSESRNCQWCNKEFTHKRKANPGRFCSRACAMEHHNKVTKQTPEHRKMLRDNMARRIKEGKHKGWASRTKLKPSYPERYFMTVLDNLSLVYTRELKVGKFFIDFAFEDKRVALEIDGKQHTRDEHVERDKRKDQFLTNCGWVVFRIKWTNPKTNKQALETRITELRNLLG